MTTLSRVQLIRRIMIGELLLNYDKASKSKEANATKINATSNATTTADKLISKCILGKPADIEKSFKEYQKGIQIDIESINARKLAIKEYVDNHFFEKDISKIQSEIEIKVKEVVGEKTEAPLDIKPPIFMDSIGEACLKPVANIDLTLGNEVYVTTDKVPKKLDSFGQEDVISIEPGEFGILMTHEYIFVPWDLIGFISVRLTHKQKGLVNISGFHVDPGYYGRLMFAVFNAGPNSVPLRYDEPVFMIMFNELSENVATIKKGRWTGMENIPVETLSGLTGTSVSVRSLDERIKRLELIFPALAAGIASIVVAIITWIITHW
jgi:dCTP deaminase